MTHIPGTRAEKVPVTQPDGSKKMAIRYVKPAGDVSPEFVEAASNAASLSGIQIDLSDDGDAQVFTTVESLGELDGVSQEALDEYGLGALNPRQVSLLAEAGLSIEEALEVAEKDVRHFDSRETPKMIKKGLSEAFPGTKFSFRTSRGGWSSYYYADWSGGPSVKEVEGVARRYKSAYFDGYDDSTKTLDDTVVQIDGEWVPASFTCDGVFTSRTADFDQVRGIADALPDEGNLIVGDGPPYLSCGCCGVNLSSASKAYHSPQTRGAGDCSKKCHAVELEKRGVTAEDLGGTAATSAPSSFKSMAEAKRAAVEGARITVTTDFAANSDRSNGHNYSGTIVATKGDSVVVQVDEDSPTNPSRRSTGRHRLYWPTRNEVSMTGGQNTIQNKSSSTLTSITIG